MLGDVSGLEAAGGLRAVQGSHHAALAAEVSSSFVSMEEHTAAVLLLSHSRLCDPRAAVPFGAPSVVHNPGAVAMGSAGGLPGAMADVSGAPSPTPPPPSCSKRRAAALLIVVQMRCSLQAVGQAGAVCAPRAAAFQA